MPKTSGLFITGTDTNVGKTFVSAVLLAALLESGINASYIKPIATGAVEYLGRRASPDAIFVKESLGFSNPVKSMTHLCLTEPLAPLAAASSEGVTISLRRVKAFIRSTLKKSRFTIIEGIGGIMVPITSGTTLLDLMASLSLPVLVVARPGLGTVNHTLLTIKALMDRRIEVAGFIFCASGPEGPFDTSILTNAEMITSFCKTPFLGSLPWITACGPLLRTALAEAARMNLSLAPILSGFLYENHPIPAFSK